MKHLTNKFRICLPIGAEVGISHLRAKTLKNTPCLFVCLRAYDSGVLRHKKGFALLKTYLAIQSPLRLRKTFEVTQKTPCSYAEGVGDTPPKSE